jgi:hypothetical protein
MLNFLQYDQWLLEYKKEIFLNQGELKNRFEKKGLKDPLARDLYYYGNDQNITALKKKFKSYWNHVESLPASNFTIYRGISYTPDSPRYKFWEDLLGDRETTNTLPIPFVKDKVKLSLIDYTSWTRDFNIAKGYADGRPGDIKVLLKTQVSNFKVLAFLDEIGDESEEIVIYPTKDAEVFYKIWRKG